jgi:hypothetical protein
VRLLRQLRLGCGVGDTWLVAATPADRSSMKKKKKTLRWTARCDVSSLVGVCETLKSICPWNKKNAVLHKGKTKSALLSPVICLLILAKLVLQQMKFWACWCHR